MKMMKKLNIFFMMIIALCLISCGNAEKSDTESTKSEENIEVKKMIVTSTIPDLPDRMDLLVTNIANYPDGKLYELRLDYNKEFSCRDYDGWDRRNLGYFYVEGNLIYRIREYEADDIDTWSEEDLKSKGTIVCQDTPLEDKLGIEERGFHETIDIEGDSCMYKSYYNNVETDFYEGFIWEKDKGLVNYYSGYGAQSFYLDIKLDGNDNE